MTRGKYAVRAAARKEEAAATQEVEGYQRAIRRLTQEKADLEAELSRRSEVTAREIRLLKAQVREGTSSQVVALEHELRKARERADEVERKEKHRQKVWDRIVKRCTDAVMAINPGMTFAQARAVLLGDIIETDAPVLVTATGSELKFAQRHGQEAARAVVKATRGGPMEPKSHTRLPNAVGVSEVQEA